MSIESRWHYICYKHKFGVVGNMKHSRIRFYMIPTCEIGFECHVTMVLKVIDFFQKYIYHNSSCNRDKHVNFFIHVMSINQNNLIQTL